jgi:type IV pilus assembly protein PilA
MRTITQSKKGFTLVEIMIVVVIIGLLAAMAIPAFTKVRENSQNKTIINNLRQIASGAQQHFLETGQTQAAEADVIGTDKYVRVIATVAGESYTGLFPVSAAATRLTVTKANTVAVHYDL